jgi:hypothetical protein
MAFKDVPRGLCHRSSHDMEILLQWDETPEVERTREAGERPINWPEVVHGAARLAGAKSIRKVSFRSLMRRQPVAFFWAPSWIAFVASFLVPCVILTWGVTRRSGLGRRIAYWRWRTILRRATVVLANDKVTVAKVASLGVQRCTIVPYYVDTDFYRATAQTSKEFDVLIVGDNDRDEQTGAYLRTRGLRVARVTSNPAVALRLRSADPTLTVFEKVSFPALRNLYANTRIVALPLLSTVTHAAGQTALLESLAMGVPVVITEGPTASAFRDLEGVFVTQAGDPPGFEAAVRRAILASYSTDPMQIRRQVEQTHSPAASRVALARAFVDATMKIDRR